MLTPERESRYECACPEGFKGDNCQWKDDDDYWVTSAPCTLNLRGAVGRGVCERESERERERTIGCIPYHLFFGVTGLRPIGKL
jgi:hypothetical protein